MSAGSRTQGRFPVGIVGGLAYAMSTGGVARAAVPLVSTFLISELSISRSQFGLSVTLMIGSVAVGVPIYGQLTDRWGAKAVLVLRGAGAGVALVGLAASQGFGQLLLFQVLLGLAISGGVPASNRVVAESVPARHRGLAMGSKQSGATAGVLLAGILLPPISVAVGWRWSIVTAALLSLLTVPAILWLLPRSTIEPGVKGSGRSSWMSLMSGHAARWLAAHGFVTGAGIAMMFSFLPLYAVEAIGLEPTSAGAVLSVMSGMAVVARVAWGRFSDVSGDLGRDLRLISAIAVVATVLVAAAAFVGPSLLWVGAVVAGLSMEAWNSLAGSGIIAAVPVAQAGRASSLVQLAFMAGNATGPVAFGFIVDTTGSFSTGWLACGVLFLVATVMRYRPRDVTAR